MEQISTSKPVIMNGEKPFQFEQFLKYLEHRSYKKGIYDVSEREYFVLMKKFNWKIRAKKLDDKVNQKVEEKFVEDKIEMNNSQIENYIEIFKINQIALKNYLKEMESQTDFFKVSDTVSFDELSKRILRHLRICNKFIDNNKEIETLLRKKGFGKKEINEDIELQNNNENSIEADINSPLTPEEKAEIQKELIKVAKENNLDIDSIEDQKKVFEIFQQKILKKAMS